MAFEIEKVMEIVLQEADERQRAAGHNGERGDGGASMLRQQVKFYKMGMAGHVPIEWEKYKQKLDPEWKEYLRLKEKFEK